MARNVSWRLFANAARVMETGWEMARNVSWRLFEECCKSNGDRLGNGQKCVLEALSLYDAEKVLETRWQMPR
jgi:hypothetical protein